MIYVLLALQILDCLTTYLAIEKFGGREANPVMARLFDKLGIIPALLATKGVVMGFIWAFYPMWGDYGFKLMVVLSVLYAWVVVNNLNAIRRRRQL